MKDYTGPERRRYVQLSDEDFERIVEASSQRSRGNFEKEVGRGAIKLVLWTMGVATIAVLGWLGVKGAIKP